MGKMIHFMLCVYIFFYHSKSKIVQCLVHQFGFTNEETKTERDYVTKAISHRDLVLKPTLLTTVTNES